MIKVGYVHNGYNEVRNILSIKSNNIVHSKVTDVFKLRDYIRFKLSHQNNFYLHNSFNDKLSFPKADVYHFFNGINYGNKPWLCTFEGFLPRYGASKHHEKKAIEAMAKHNCKKLIAFSNFNKNLQLNFLKDKFPEYYDVISSKIEVVYPPQKTHGNKNLDKYDNLKVLKLLFVGHDFFRKGGREVFNVVEQLVAQGFDIELTVVSKLSPDDFISKTTKNDSRVWLEKITHATFCSIHESLSNEKVLDLMRASHVFVFPSLQDTFGYVVLEAQASATPVISTNIRALPEINNQECGWLIDVPQTEKGFADIYSNGYNAISQKIDEELKTTLHNILQDTSVLKQKAENSFQRIGKFHSPEVYSKKLLSYFNL